jgi:hypothetical protein
MMTEAAVVAKAVTPRSLELSPLWQDHDQDLERGQQKLK